MLDWTYRLPARATPWLASLAGLTAIPRRPAPGAIDVEAPVSITVRIDAPCRPDLLVG